MPTRAKKGKKTQAQNATKSPGFFERAGAKLDRVLNWFFTQVQRMRQFYQTWNDKYLAKLHAHKIMWILPPSLVVLAPFIMMVPVYTAQISDNNTVLLRNGQIDATAIEPITISSDTELMQDVWLENDEEILRLGVLVGTFMRTNHATYEFQFKKGGDVIYAQTFSATKLADNQYYIFKFNKPISCAKNDDCSFAIRAIDAPANNTIAVYRDTETQKIIYSIYIQSDFHNFTIVATIIFLLIFFAINFLINSGKIKTEAHFLFAMLIFIVPVAFIYPAYTIPDEPYHFASALRLAQYDWSKTPAHNLAKDEYNLPENSKCLDAFYTHEHGAGPVVTRDDVLVCFAAAQSKSDAYVSASPTGRVAAYLIATSGIILGDFISDSPMVIFYFGRLFNLCAIVLIVLFALKVAKKYQLVLLAIVFIPMFLQQAISYSYDGILNALCLLVIAYAIRFLTTDAQVQKRDIAVLAVALAFIGLIKLPYILIAAPMIAIKSKKFGKRKYVKWIVAAGILMASVALYIIDMCISQNGISATVSTNGPARGMPLSTFWTQPRTTISIFLRTLYLGAPWYIISMIGYFGWFDFALSHEVIFAYIIFLLVVALSHGIKLSKSARLWAGLATTTILGSLFLVMYLQWTTKGSFTIEGVQGRYFLPLIPLLMFAFMPQKSQVNLPVTTFYAFVSFVMLCFTITLLIGFY